MPDFFKSRKPEISALLGEFLESKKVLLSSVNGWGSEVPSRLLDFTAPGKMLRGGLVLLSHDLYYGKSKSAAMQAAAAMELFQSGFLIHDDIMDRDLLRRGKESLFYQYKIVGEKEGFKDPYHFGESMGICAGDITFFLSFEILSGLDCPADIRNDIIKLFSGEFTSVGLAQMQDVYFGSLGESPGEDAVLRLYRYKTGRYTFSLPLVTGAILAGAGIEAREKLTLLGEDLGLIFQIKDDEIGLFGEPDRTGKPVGSDLKESKKTLYHYYLLNKSVGADRQRLMEIFGSGRVSEDDIDFTRSLVSRLGINEIVGKKVRELRNSAAGLIGGIENADPASIAVLLELLDYSVGRTN